MAMFCHMAPAREGTPTHLVTDKQTPGAMRTTITTSDCKGVAVVMDAMGKQADRYFQNTKDVLLLQTDSRTLPVLPLFPIPLINPLLQRGPPYDPVPIVFLESCGTSDNDSQKWVNMEMKGRLACSSHQVLAAGTVQRALFLFPQSPFLQDRGGSGVMQQGTPVGLLCFIFLAARTHSKVIHYQDRSGSLPGTIQEPFTALRRSITPSHGCITAS